VPLDIMTSQPQRASAQPVLTTNYRILVVEDAPDTRELLRLLFEAEGYEVLTAGDGLSAVEMARTELPDAIVMDMSLPGLDGYNAAKLIRRDPALACVPLIACTAFNRWEWGGKAIAAGFDAFLTKPIDARRLSTTVSSLLSRKADRGVR